MANGKPNQIRYEPCRLVINPTGATGASLSGSYPYGGTEIGLAKEILWQPGRERLRLIGEEFGGKSVGSSYREPAPRLAANMRGSDADLLALVPGGASASSGSVVSTTTSSPQPGILLTRVKLLLVPWANDAANSDGRACILYAATVLEDIAARIRRGYSHEYVRPLVWEGELDDNGRVYKDQCTLAQIVV